jgi:hypothetical protein
MPLITREGKGSKLTIAEMDGNLTYLQGLSTPKMLVSTLENKELVNIINATEGTSIPDSSTAEYQKTIPLSFIDPTLLYVAVIHSELNPSININPLDLGISSISISSVAGYSTGDAPSRLRFIVTNDYTTTRLSGVLADSFLRNESNVTPPLMIEAPTYTQNNGTLFGIYAGTTTGAGYTSDSGVNLQGNSVIKSMYINNDGNLVLLLKKRSSTTSATWTSLKLNVYNIS